MTNGAYIRLENDRAALRREIVELNRDIDRLIVERAEAMEAANEMFETLKLSTVFTTTRLAIDSTWRAKYAWLKREDPE